MDTSKSFKWRENARKLVFSKNDKDFKLVIALRTNDFNKKNNESSTMERCLT